MQGPKNKVGCFGILIVFLSFVFLLNEFSCFDSKEEKNSPQKSSVEPETREYSPDDALEDLDKTLSKINSMIEESKSLDFSAANRMVGYLNATPIDVRDTKEMFEYNSSIEKKADSILVALPKVQKVVFPKLRKEWIKFQNEALAEDGIKGKCLDNTCRNARFSGRVLQGNNAIVIANSLNVGMNKFRFRKVKFVSGSGWETVWENREADDLDIE